MAEFNPPFLGKIQRPHFCPELINIGEFCSSFSKEIDEILPEGAEWATMAESMRMPQAAVGEVAEICSVKHLTCEGEPAEPGRPTRAQLDRRLSVKASFPNITGDLTGGWDETIDEQAASKLKSLRIQRRKNNIINRSVARSRFLLMNLRYRAEVRLESDRDVRHRHGEYNYLQAHSKLEPMVAVRLYRPPRNASASLFFQEQNSYSTRQIFRMSQEILCLGKNTLTELRDEIRCPNDDLVINDCSELPASTRPVTAKETYPSGFFCINGVFYVDDRNPNSVDYTKPIREWAAGRVTSDLPHGSMKKVHLRELNVRIGYPYIYVHQGRCQHLVVFSDVRLFRPGFDVRSRSYPRTVSIKRQSAQSCDMCDGNVAGWLTMDHELTPTNHTLFCDTCFYQFNYRPSPSGGPLERLCRFKAYPLHKKTRSQGSAADEEGAKGAGGSGGEGGGGIGFEQPEPDTSIWDD